MDTCLVRVAEIEGKGRALIASQPLRAGQVVLADSPILVYSAQPSDADRYCCNCFRTLPLLPRPPPSLQSCPSCSHLFCGPTCLSLALSSSHSPWVCQTLRRLRDSPAHALAPNHHELHLQARFLVAAYNLAMVSPSQFGILLSLQGQASPQEIAAAAVLHSLVSFLCPPPTHYEFSVELAAALLAKEKLNAFGLMEPFSPDGRRSVRAYALYPKASLFNHDCLPNACRFDYVDTAPERNTDIVVRIIHDVPQGREVSLSYFPVNDNYSDRQRRLLEDYGFICECDRCKVEANWSDKDDEDEAMDEDHNDLLEDGDDDFPHAYFFLRYMCDRENCWGTLAPLPPSDVDTSPSNILECNVCGNLKKDDDFGVE